MTVYARVAGRYAIEASDEADIDEFFLKIVPTLSEREREQIFKELIAASGLPNQSTIAQTEIPQVIPLLPLDDNADGPAVQIRRQIKEEQRYAREIRDTAPDQHGDAHFAAEYKKYYRRVTGFTDIPLRCPMLRPKTWLKTCFCAFTTQWTSIAVRRNGHFWRRSLAP
jgi:hypothetical protein